MATNVKEKSVCSVELSEYLLQALHLNRTVTMAVEFLEGSSDESIEAIQGTLRQQEKILQEIYELTEVPKKD